MGDSSWEHIYLEDMQQHIRQHGMIGIQEYLELQLGRWSDIELNIGITGHVGCGKSSFINTIRG
jgi:predicted GTPase